MGICARFIFKFQENFRKASYCIFRETVIKRAFAQCGKNVHIAEGCDIKGIENIYIGDGSSIGTKSILWTIKAKIVIKDKVITGPRISIITGNHRTDVIGKFIADVTDGEKKPENDEDVIIERDVWIGANATILKGVHIAEGCVIAANAVVTKSTEPFGIYAGVPAKQISKRFSDYELDKHLNIVGAV